MALSKNHDHGLCFPFAFPIVGPKLHATIHPSNIGREADIQDFVREMDIRQRSRTLSLIVDSSVLLSLADLEWVPSKVKSGAHLKFNPDATARASLPMAMKAKVLLCEPVHSKGGIMWNLYKGQGIHLFRKSYRGRLLPAKLFQSVKKAQRTRLLPFAEKGFQQAAIWRLA